MTARRQGYADALRSDTQFSGLQDRLKSARESLRLTQLDMAKRLGVNKSSWQSYETGSQTPGSQVIAALVREGFNSNWLLTGEGPMKIEDYRQVTPAQAPQQLTSAFLDGIPDSLGLDEQNTRIAKEEIRQLKNYLREHGWVDPSTVPVVNLSLSAQNGWLNLKETSLRSEAPPDIARSSGGFAAIIAGDELAGAGVKSGFLLFCDRELEPKQDDMMLVERNDGLAAIKIFAGYAERGRSKFMLLEGLGGGEQPPETLELEQSAVKQSAVVVYIKRRL